MSNKETMNCEDLNSIEFLPGDFELKQNKDAANVDQNFASVSYWKEVRIRFFLIKVRCLLRLQLF